MAVVKAINGGKDLSRAIRYILQKSKTRHDLIGGHNLVNPQNAYREMRDTKKYWGKPDGRVYQHYTISYHPDLDITAEEVLEITAELIGKSPLFRDHEIVYAVHTDCNHLHAHVICNSVSLADGRKFQCSKDELEELKRLCGRIVREHGYPLECDMEESKFAAPDSTAAYQVLVQAHEGTRSSWVRDLGIAVQTAERAALDKEKFIQEMRILGYNVRWGKRTITYTTPDGHSMRASKLEDTYKLPSIREKYADRETEQEQLREDLHQAKPRRKQQEFDDEPAVDYSAYTLDLTSPEDGIPGIDVDISHQYETACAVCRQLRCARTADEFYEGMRQGGFRVRYDKAARQHWIRTPYGNEIPAEELEAAYGLPSIRRAVIQLHRRPYHPLPKWDGIIYPEYLERTTDRHWDAILDEDDETSYIRRAAGRAAYRRHANRRPMADRCARVHTYIHPDSPMWDQELQAAALVLGHGVCDPDSLDDTLREHGYRLVTGGAVTYLQTPRDRRIVIDDNPPKSIPDKGPFHCGIIAEAAGECLRNFGSSRKYASRREQTDEAAGEIIALAVLGAGALIETVARLIIHGIQVFRRKRREKTVYTVATKKASMTLEEALERAGIKAEFPEKIPQAQAPSEKETREESAQPVPEPQVEKRWADRMDELLQIVKNASVAADRETFVELLRNQGCGTRWTEGGTLTIIMPDGEHVRASQLEKRYRLPSIAAAYGSDRRVPRRGARYEATQIVRQAMEAADDRAGFDAALNSAGYKIEWKADGSDATIIAPGGQHMRLSSLNQIFGLSRENREEGENGIQSAAAAGSGRGKLGQLRRAIHAAGDSVSPGTADTKDSRSGRFAGNAGGTNQKARREYGGKRDSTRDGDADIAGRAQDSERASMGDDFER